MEESNRRKSWVDMLEDEDMPEKMERIEESTEDKEQRLSEVDVPMDVDTVNVKTEPEDGSNSYTACESSTIPSLIKSEKSPTDSCSLSIKQEPREELKDEGIQGAEGGWAQLVKESSVQVKEEPVERPEEKRIGGAEGVWAQLVQANSARVKKESDKKRKKNSTNGAEGGWSQLVEHVSEDKGTTPGKLTFAQICAKSSNPNSPVVSVKSEPVEKQTCSAGEGIASPEKKDRKRSLFPDEPKGKESFGILDEQSIDSPCKDIREIMTNIHMDSPLKEEKQDENQDTSNTRRTSPRKGLLLKSRDLREALKSPNKSGDSNRKRTREKSKNQDSPAPKIPHVSKSPPSKASDDPESLKVRAPKLQFETDKDTLLRRHKQIEYGKNTLGYQRYIKMVPKEAREKRHPKTPPRHLRYSRRAWDGLVKVWRQKLHFWDPPKDGEETPTELPESWDNLSDYSASMSDTTSEKSESIPSTPQSEHKPRRKSSRQMKRERSQSDSEIEGKEMIATK